MTCPFCSHRQDKVIDSRESKDGQSIRRRRQCLECERRYTTYERCDEVPFMVIKKDGRREHFDRQKVLNGLLRACEKRPISMSKLADLVDIPIVVPSDNTQRIEDAHMVLGHLFFWRMRQAVEEAGGVRT